MYLASPTVLPYLVARGLLADCALVDDDLTIVEAGRRNRNFKLLRRDGSGYFIKQTPLPAQETMASLRREGALYHLSRECEGFTPLRAVTPALRHYDGDRHMLVVDLVPQAQSLTLYSARADLGPAAGLAVAAMVGRLLATLHQGAPSILPAAAELTVFPRTPPWFLSIIDGADVMAPTIGKGCRDILALIRQSPALRAQIPQVRAEWGFTALIHGDMKWENILVAPPAPDQTVPEVRIVDWELVDIGDPAWDVACTLVAYIQPLMSAGQPGAVQLYPFAGALPAQLAHAQALCRSFWQAYAADLPGGPSAQAVLLWRVARLAAARLALAAFEMAQMQETAPPSALVAVQAAEAMIADPALTLRDVFTLSMGG